jgi:hypothetical protein
LKPSKLSSLIAEPDSAVVLRGEIWVSPGVLTEAGFDQDPGGLVGFASSLEADVCFFHWPESALGSDLKELTKLAHGAGLGCGLTIDGPFQRLTATRDVLDILRELGRDRAAFQRLLAREMEEITGILSLIEQSEIDLILVGEDIGYAGGLYFSPEVFRSYLLPCYQVLVSRLGRMALGWHSDGAVEPILRDLVQCGFRFFSLEPECVDLLNFKRAYGSRVTLISGIRAAWLAAKEFDRERQGECLQEIIALAREGGLILASSGGLYSPELLPNLRELYRLIEDMAPAAI